MPKRTNEEGDERSQSGLVYKKLDAIETVELKIAGTQCKPNSHHSGPAECCHLGT